MGFMCFGVNNQRELYLMQERFDGAVTLKTYDGDEVENAIEISPGDFVMLVNHYRNCKETGHPIVLDSYEPEPEERWFSQVRWSNKDIENALEYKCIEPTDEMISRVRSRLEHHSFTDIQIEHGWDFIYATIDNLKLVTYRVYFNNNDATEVDAECEDEAVELAKIIAAESGVEFELDEVECLGNLV